MQNSRHQAFTLVELLVVLAIISVLAGMSLASINTVRDASKSVSCKNNLRQIGLGVAAYATQNDDYLPAAYIYAGFAPYFNFDSDNLPGFLITTMDMPVPVLTTAPSNPVKSVFMCPASGSTVMFSPRDSNWTNPNFATSDEANGYAVLPYLHRPTNAYRYLTQSYTVNAAIVHNRPSWFPFEEFLPYPGGTLTGKRMSKISPFSSVVMMFDGGQQFHDGAIARMAARHQNRTLTNLVFFDGHVAAYPTYTDLQRVWLLQSPGGEKVFSNGSPTGEKQFVLGAGYESMY